MAVIKFGSIVTSGQGSLGGSTIQADRSGHILRNKPFPKKSRTPAQSVIRSVNKTMQAGWRSLTNQDRTVWNDFASSKPVFNRSGEKHPLSGHSLWLKYQFAYLSNLLPFQLDPYKASIGPFGPEIITNPNFLDIPGWTLQPNVTIAGGLLHFENTSNYARQTVPSVISLNYRITVTLHSFSFGFVLGGLFGSKLNIGTIPGIYTFDRIATVNHFVFLWSRLQLGTFDISYCSLKQLLP